MFEERNFSHSNSCVGKVEKLFLPSHPGKSCSSQWMRFNSFTMKRHILHILIESKAVHVPTIVTRPISPPPPWRLSFLFSHTEPGSCGKRIVLAIDFLSLLLFVMVSFLCSNGKTIYQHFPSEWNTKTRNKTRFVLFSSFTLVPIHTKIPFHPINSWSNQPGISFRIEHMSTSSIDRISIVVVLRLRVRMLLGVKGLNDTRRLYEFLQRTKFCTKVVSISRMTYSRIFVFLLLFVDVILFASASSIPTLFS